MKFVPKSLSGGPALEKARLRLRTLECFRLVRLLSPVARVVITVAFGRGTSDRSKQLFADFGRSRSDPDKRSPAPIGEGNESGRGREFLEVSGRLRARESVTALEGSGSNRPGPASHSMEVTREISTVQMFSSALRGFSATHGHDH